MNYYGARTPRAANPPYGTVVGALNPMIVCNGATAVNPLTQRFASAAQVSNWLGFLSAHSATIRGGLAAPPVIIHCRMEGGDWFPYTI